MISRKSIRATIDAVEAELRACFDILASLAHPQATPSGTDILEFQPRLLAAITKIEAAYRAIKQEEKRLIQRKASLNGGWFARRLGNLAQYGEVIRDVLGIARAIGDGFAWVFYENDRNLVVEHLKLQPQLLLPPGLGALGERLMLENWRGIEGKLLIYHGTTSFLRIGDISLIDPLTMRVACIGEIKTEQLDPTSVRVSVTLVAGDRMALPKLSPAIESTKSSAPQSRPSPAIEARFARQKQRMSEALANAAATNFEHVNANNMNFHYDALREIVRKSHDRKFEWMKVGDGLVLGAVRTPKMLTLSDRFLPRMKDKSHELAVGVEGAALNILRKEPTDNSLLVGDIGGKRSYTEVRGEMVPFVLWPTDVDVVRDILFGRVLVMSLFNPGHIWAAIRDRGFEVKLDERGRLVSATKRFGGKEMGLENMSYFIDLIYRSLMTEDAVLAMIDQLIDLSQSRHTGEATGIRVELAPRIFRSNPR